MNRPTWCQLLNPKVLDFVLAIDPGTAAAMSSTAHPFGARRFGDLSVFDVAQADRIRDLMAGGWESYLDKLLRVTGIRLGERDVAYWILGREPSDGATVAHLAYLPATAGSAPLVPVNLLAPGGPTRRSDSGVPEQTWCQPTPEPTGESRRPSGERLESGAGARAAHRGQE